MVPALFAAVVIASKLDNAEISAHQRSALQATPLNHPLLQSAAAIPDTLLP
mgnify:CR=1 FL=1